MLEQSQKLLKIFVNLALVTLISLVVVVIVTEMGTVGLILVIVLIVSFILIHLSGITLWNMLLLFVLSTFGAVYNFKSQRSLSLELIQERHVSGQERGCEGVDLARGLVDILPVNQFLDELLDLLCPPTIHNQQPVPSDVLFLEELQLLPQLSILSLDESAQLSQCQALLLLLKLQNEP